MSEIDPCQNQLGMFIMYECANSIVALCQGHINVMALENMTDL